MKVISNRVNLQKLPLKREWMSFMVTLFCHQGHTPHTTAEKTNLGASSILLNMVTLHLYFTARTFCRFLAVATTVATTKYF